MVSIGTPDKAQALIQHLELQTTYGTHTKLFVDPNNTIYDALDLNRGLQRTFFNIATPFAFLDRIQKGLVSTPNGGGGLQDLFLILSKWNKAAYIPPKLEQSLLQGGTFVFFESKTLFAHYDPSTAAHASINQVLEIVSLSKVVPTTAVQTKTKSNGDKRIDNIAYCECDDNIGQ